MSSSLKKCSSVVRLVARAFATQISTRRQVELQGRFKSHLVAACSGFPKDLLYGPSTVLRKDGFGDDAFFISQHSRLGDVLGVADGVGGWRDYGIDPSYFSRSLMKTCAQLVKTGQFDPADPIRLISDSYKEVVNYERTKHRPNLGSSTVCIVALDCSSSLIHTANIGDSGLLVFRNGRLVHRSEEQLHYFNTPFQLSLPVVSRVSSVNVDGFLSDHPESAETTVFEVVDGDLILVATDGLFDNMPIGLIENEIAKTTNFEKDDIQMLCNSIALQARRLAMDRNHNSPFAQKAQDIGIDAKGGKPDDITLILAIVRSVEIEPSGEGSTFSSQPEDAP